MRFKDLLGFEHLSSGGGKARLRCRVGPEHLNVHGTAHGGFLYSLADEAFALASNSHDVAAVALNVHMDYFSVVKEGDVARWRLAGRCCSACPIAGVAVIAP